MLADGGGAGLTASGLRADLHLPNSARLALLDFIRRHLASWRDHPERPRETAEEPLTGQLCDHLNDVSRLAVGWDHFKFSTERRDEHKRSRKYDLAVQPSGRNIWVGADRHSTFEIILPIECKILPTPKSTKRDQREYLFDSYKSCGGVQRFKAGDHGSSHRLCGMIGYVQNEDSPTWRDRINNWVEDLTKADEAGWSRADALTLADYDKRNRLAVLHSRHERSNPLSAIEITHLWIEI